MLMPGLNRTPVCKIEFKLVKINVFYYKLSDRVPALTEQGSVALTFNSTVYIFWLLNFWSPQVLSHITEKL